MIPKKLFSVLLLFIVLCGIGAGAYATGYYQKTGTAISPTGTFALGTTTKNVTSLHLNITSGDDPYTEFAALNPRAWWKFDNTTGSIILDTTGHGYTGTAYNGMAWGTGKYNNAGVFDNIDDYVSLPTSIIPDVYAGQYTVAIWFNCSNTMETHRLFECTNNSTVAASIYNGNLRVGRYTGGTYYSKYHTTLNTNQWYCLVITSTGNGNLVPYLNNVTMSTTTYNPSVVGSGAYFSSPSTGRQLSGRIGNALILPYAANASVRNILFYDNPVMIQARSNANTTYSGFWNSSSNNPISVPSKTTESISNVSFKVPTTATHNNVTIRNFNQTVGTFTPSVKVYMTQAVTTVRDWRQGNNTRRVDLIFAPLSNFTDVSAVLDLGQGTYCNVSVATNETGTSWSKTLNNVSIDADTMTSGTSRYFNISTRGGILSQYWYGWNPNNESCNAKVRVNNSSMCVSWNITTYNVTDGNTYKLVYAENGTEVGSATAVNGSASIIIVGLVDGAYWLTETPVLTGFVNVPAVAVVIIGAAGAFVGGSFINKWYRRRRGS